MNSTPPSARRNTAVVFGAGVPDVLADQVAAVRLDQVAAVEQAERGEEPPVEPGHRGLAGARVAGEDQVAAQRRRRQARLLAPP